MEDFDARRTAAIERLEAKRNFYKGLAAYVFVNGLLVVIWAVSDGDPFFWPIWSIGGWGLALVIQYWTMFLRKPISEEAIRREMEAGR